MKTTFVTGPTFAGAALAGRVLPGILGAALTAAALTGCSGDPDDINMDTPGRTLPSSTAWRSWR